MNKGKVTARIIEDVIDNIAERKIVYAEAVEVLIEVKSALEIAKANGFADGSITGKNPEMREAAAREALADGYYDLEKAEEHEREAKLNLEMAYLDLDSLKLKLRLLELAQISPARSAADRRLQYLLDRSTNHLAVETE